MKKIAAVFLFGICLLPIATVWPADQKPFDYVNPFFCTAGDHGQLFPGAVLPFGMIKLSPDTYPGGFNRKSHSGYDYLDEKIMGFSHVRLGGEGCSGAGGNILFLPFIGAPCSEPADYATAFAKKDELACPGFYRVRLGRRSILCELSVTPHCGFQRYVFPKSDSSHILLDLRRGFTEVRDAAVTYVGQDRIEGYVTAGHLCGSQHNYTVYFSTSMNRPCRAIKMIQDGKDLSAPRIATGRLLLIMDFHTADQEEIILKTGLSAVGVEQARQNVVQELSHWSIDRLRELARAAWDDYLSRIEVQGSLEDKQLFYTALYHSCQMPVQALNADSTYRGTDGRVHQAKNFSYYDSYSLWDTFRTKYPLLSLLKPLILQDIVRSLVKIYEHGETDWPFPTVRREHSTAVIADAYFKGLRDFDLEQAFQGMRCDAFEFRAEYGNAAAGVKSRMEDSTLRRIYQEYDRLGYMPKRPDRTQENCYDNWCVAQMARALGKEEEHRRFSQRALFYKNVWDPEIRFFRARDAEGQWLPFPDPRVIDETYVYEATMWQWRWFVLHDIPGLIDLCGGRDRFIKDLDFFFENDLYNHNNEQDLHVAFLYNLAGAPWRSQEYIHRILTQPMRQIYGSHGFYPQPYFGRIYKAEPACYLYEMDDDCGTMSSWYVLASMGLYQICVGDPVFQLTSPLFKRIVIHMDPKLYEGKKFIIEAENLSEKNYYIQSASLNGRRLNRSHLSYQEIVAGGKLVYQMGPNANKNWGIE